MKSYERLHASTQKKTNYLPIEKARSKGHTTDWEKVRIDVPKILETEIIEVAS